MPSTQTLRYRALSRHVYSQALLALVTYARTSQDDFEVYPDTVAMLEHAGLAVSGADLTGVSKVLGGIEGLTREEA